MLHGLRRTCASVVMGMTLIAGCFISCKKAEAPAKETGAPAEAQPVATVGADLPAQVTLRIGESSGLNEPRGVCVDKSGNLYVADTHNYRVVVFDRAGRELLTFGRKGAGPGEFMAAAVLAMTPDDNVAVLDRETNWIQTFDPKGKFLKRIGGPKPGFSSPRGMAVARDGTLYVADTGDSRVVILNSDGELKGDPIKTAGKQPLNQPTDVSIDPQGNLHIYQPIGPKDVGLLFNFSPALTYRNTSLSLTAPSTSDSPRFVPLSDGRMYASDPHQRRVVVFSANGGSQNPIRLEGPLASALKVPAGIAVDSQGQIFVADVNANVIYRFKL